MRHKISSDWDARIWIDGVGDAERRLEITPAIAGWASLSFRTYTFRAGQVIDGESATDEMCMVVLSGSITMEAAGQAWVCDGRASVFDGRPHVIYLPPGNTYRMTVHRDADCAYGRAPAKGARSARLITPDEIAIETVSQGNVAGQIAHLLTPGDAEQLRCVEVSTPAGHWSPHPPLGGVLPEPSGDSTREEVVYVRFTPEDGWALQRLSTTDPDHDEVIIARHGDAVMIRGEAFPIVTAPGADLWSLHFFASPTPS